MGLIVQNMIAKWEIPSLIKLTASKSGTVAYLVLIKVEWVMPKVSCLSLEGRARGRGGTPHGENGRNKKSFFFFSSTIQPLIKIGLEGQRVPLYNEKWRQNNSKFLRGGETGTVITTDAHRNACNWIDPHTYFVHKLPHVLFMGVEVGYGHTWAITFLSAHL